MSKTSITIQYTLTVKTCIEHIAAHLNHHDAEARLVIANILPQFEEEGKRFSSLLPGMPGAAENRRGPEYAVHDVGHHIFVRGIG
ncbi:hypothetical protein [Enterobacter mori]|uniref:hypothetical protein n=1 Tax=Enterobacter mori TaxID=539813 RepID=UPI003B8422F7